MNELIIKGLTFSPDLSREQIAKQVARVAEEIKRDCVTDNPIFICVLNGAFIFAADLFRAVNLPKSEITFIRYKSYDGTKSTGVVQEVMGLTIDITDREVIIIEDIVDTGITAKQLRDTIKSRNPKSVKMAALLFKPESLSIGNPPEYVGFEIPPKFIIGYGLDLDEQVRSLPDIWSLKSQETND